jgi:hypothetical protein
MEPVLTLEDLAHACRVERAAIVEWVELGVVRASGGAPGEWRFDGGEVERVGAVARLARELDLAPFAAALVDDLVRERRRLEQRVRALERLLGE